MPQNNTQGTLSSMVPQGTPAAPSQQPPSFGQKLLGNKEYSVEINDAVMETEAWKGSRYNGRQLEASKINQFTKGDKTYGKTAVVEKYSKNIYVGNRVIGHDSTPTFDNPSPGFSKKSYISFEGYYTINSDDTVSRVGVNFNDINSRKGFERSFREDFSIGTKASITILDKGVEHNLKNTYTVDFNEGILSRLLEYSSSLDVYEDIINFRARSTTSPITGNHILSPSISTGFLPTTLSPNASLTIYNNAQSKYFVDVSGSGENALISVFRPFIIDTIAHYNEDLASNKIFMEFKTPETTTNSPYSYNIESFGLNSVNVVEIDINNSNISNEFGNNFSFRIKAKNKFSNPLAEGTLEDDGQSFQTDHFTMASNNVFNTPANNVVFYKLNPIPSLLIDLIKEEELPNGIGEQGFIVIPENFDPALKPQLNKILKNKLNFDIKGGVNTNDDTNPFFNRFNRGKF